MEITGIKLEILDRLYLCDGSNKKCKKGLCYRTNPDGKGVCCHTRDIKHALPWWGQRKFTRVGNCLFEVRGAQ